jgi:hypothetical protein
LLLPSPLFPQNKEGGPGKRISHRFLLRSISENSSPAGNAPFSDSHPLPAVPERASFTKAPRACWQLSTKCSWTPGALSGLLNPESSLSRIILNSQLGFFNIRRGPSKRVLIANHVDQLAGVNKVALPMGGQSPPRQVPRCRPLPHTAPHFMP